MDIKANLEIINDAIKKGEYIHPNKLGVKFKYIPNPYNQQSTYADNFGIFVDNKDKNVYIYLDNMYTFLYEIKS